MFLGAKPAFGIRDSSLDKVKLTAKQVFPGDNGERALQAVGTAQRLCRGKEQYTRELPVQRVWMGTCNEGSENQSLFKIFVALT